MINHHTLLAGLTWTLAGLSAVLTGIFGSTFGGNSFVLTIIFFVIFALISTLCPLLIHHFFATLLRCDYVKAGILVFFCAFFVLTDLITNAGTAALFRASDLNRTENQNLKAKNARNEVTRIEKRIREIRAQTAWQSKYLAPKAYDDQIEAARLIRDNEAKRGGCGRICEEKTKAMAELTAAKANALYRQSLKAEMMTLESELRDAKLASAETPTQASAALTHASNVAAGITGQVDPSAGAKFWANYGLSIWSGIAVTFASMAAAILLAFSGASMPARREPEPPAWERNPLPDLRPTAKQEAEEARIVLQQYDHTDDSLALLMQAVERINARYA